MALFELVSKYQPTGDQPAAIEKLVSGLKEGKKEQVLLGGTGTGKTFNEFTYSACSLKRSCATSTIAFKSIAVSSVFFTLHILLHHVEW